MKEKKCAYCGKSFVPTSGRQLYCSEPHFKTCPVCGNQYQVSSNVDLKKPAVACSYSCRRVRREQTSLERYGIKAPGNNPKARKKAKEKMQERFGVDYAMQSAEVRDKAIASLKEKYGVTNAQHIVRDGRTQADLRRESWERLVLQELPIKQSQLEEGPMFRILEDNMDVYVLKETASITFLQNYGHRINAKFGRIHTSIGLVEDGILYQVLRFERKKDQIVLADFGTRGNYFNPNYYSKLLNVAINTIGIEEFVCDLPRGTATPELIQSLLLELDSEGVYEVYWKLPEGLRKLNRRDDIIAMKQKYDYITTDYLDHYIHR